MKKLNIRKLLITLIIFSFLLRIIGLSYPHAYVFDEVYYVFTAKEYTKNNKDAWVYWTKSADNKAYAWVNPPLPQEIIAGSIKVFGDKSWAWRLPGVILGTLSIYLVFLIAEKLFNKRVGLIAGFLFAFDGLNFVQSRTAMLDIYLVAFILISLFFNLKRKYFLAALFLGLAFASKWTAIYLLPLEILILIKQKDYFKLLLFLIAPLVYLLTFLPFFLYGYSAQNYIELVKQQIYYHTHLKATHAYASAWWSWPLNLYPVWYYVDYQKDKITNIFSAGNPLLFWLGSLSVIAAIIEFVKKRNFNLLLTILGFLFFLLPWAASPRIMFLYYFAPAVPFLSIALAYQTNKLLEIKKYQSLGIFILVLTFLSFMLIFPFLVGVSLPKNFVNAFFDFNLAPNPF